MRLISSNENKSEWPKRHICENCGAELEYDEADVHVGWMGCEYVTCPNCNGETMLSGERIQRPTWKATFDHTRADDKVIDIPDHEVGVYVDTAVQTLCSDKFKLGEFYVAKTGNLLVVGIKWDDGVDIYVTKDYWEDTIDVEDYDKVK